MGGTVSKAAKQIGLEDLKKLAALEDDIYTTDNKNNKRKSNAIWRKNRGSVGCLNNEKLVSASRREEGKSKELKRKKKQKQHSVSVKKRNARYKKVTKSIIGRPTNFQHTGHIGATQSLMERNQVRPEILPQNKDMLSTQLLGITALLNASSTNDQHTASRTPRRARSNKSKTKQSRALQPPNPPPHQDIPRPVGRSVDGNTPATAQQQEQQQQQVAPPSVAAYPKAPPLHNARSSFRKRQHQQQHQRTKRSIGPRSRLNERGMPPSLRPAPAR